MASGDISLTSPVTKTIPGLTLQSISITAKAVTAMFVDGIGGTWIAQSQNLTDGPSTGFNIATQTVLSVDVTSGFTSARNALLSAGATGAAARVKALVQQLQTDGIIVATGTVA